MKKEIISGIYKIENMVNGKTYIGSSKNINSRWKQHINMLKNKKHHSIKLQRAWDKYGEDSFEFSILEQCDEDKLLYLEQYYIDKLKSYSSGYNSKEKTIDDKYMSTVEINEEEQPWLHLLNNFVSKTDRIIFDDSKTNNRIRMNRVSETEAGIYMCAVNFFLLH